MDTTNFAPLRRTSASDLERLKEEMKKQNSNQREEDKRFWAPQRDKAGNAYAVIRFLPEIKEGDVPFVKVFDHGFKGPGGWYIEKSLTTIGKDDPVSEFNSKLWDSGIEANKEIARRQKRRLKYISNIYVVSDPKNPENEGKVFLFRYGKKIFDKINEKMNPQFPDEKPAYPFDWFEGCNFKLKVHMVGEFPNYDKSEFESSSQLADEKRMMQIAQQRYDLSEFVDPKRGGFKSYEELKRRLNKVLGLDGGTQATGSEDDGEDKQSAPWNEDDDRTTWSKPPVEVTPTTKPQVMAAPTQDPGGDELDFFKQIAAQAAAKERGEIQN